MKTENEALSNLMDEFNESNTAQTVLNSVLNDVNQQRTLTRYHLMGEIMRNETPNSLNIDFVSSVSTKIDLEPNIAESNVNSVDKLVKERSSLWSRLFKPTAGLALAASVAFIAISTVNLQTVTTVPSDTLAAVSQNSTQQKVQQLAETRLLKNVLRVSSNPGSQSSLTPGMQWKTKRDKPVIQSKLNSYLVNHTERSPSMHGIIPQVRVVGFDAQK